MCICRIPRKPYFGLLEQPGLKGACKKPPDGCAYLEATGVMQSTAEDCEKVLWYRTGALFSVRILSHASHLLGFSGAS